MHTRATLAAVAVGSAALTLGGLVPAQAGTPTARHPGGDDHLTTVVDGLQGPRGVDALGRGLTLVTETDGTFSLVVERRHHHHARVVELGKVAADFAPAIAAGHDGTIYVLTGGAEPDTPSASGSATLYTWHRGMTAPTVLADIGKYQKTDPDPYDLEKAPTDSNPFGLAALGDGSVLVADAGGNDLLRVTSAGVVSTVARLKPRTVAVPPGLPPTDPDGNPLPPAGTMVPAEAVATSVTVGADGSWYVGELRGFPATPGTSEIWRIAPGTVGAVCDPANPGQGACTRYADGLTSIVDLGADRSGAIYAVELSKMSWLQMELGTKGATIGGLFRLSERGHHHHCGGQGPADDRRSHRQPCVRELVPDQLTQPGGVDVSGDGIYVTGPVFGPGSLMKIDTRHHHHH